jgi:small subunit ribosomal protein S21
MNKKSNFFGNAVEVKEYENINQALRRFKKKIEESGILEDVKKKEFYEKPTSVRKRKKSSAKARWRKKLRDQQLPQKLY